MKDCLRVGQNGRTQYLEWKPGQRARFYHGESLPPALVQRSEKQAREKRWKKDVGRYGTYIAPCQLAGSEAFGESPAGQAHVQHGAYRARDDEVHRAERES